MATTVADDTFERPAAITGGWGTADTGGAWSILAGGTSPFSVTDGKGVVTLAANAERVAHLASTSVRDLDAVAEVGFDSFTGPGNAYVYLVLRRQSTGGYLRVGLFTTGGNMTTRIGDSAGTQAFPDVNTGLPFTAGGRYLMRVQMQGANPTTVRVRAWKPGTPEPTTWLLNQTTTLGPQVAGAVGIRGFSNTTATLTARYDNFKVTPLG